jgi:8-oxo-dGTP diphosphatase
LILLEAQEGRWLAKDELDSVEWLPADLGLVEIIHEQMY